MTEDVLKCYRLEIHTSILPLGTSKPSQQRSLKITIPFTFVGILAPIRGMATSGVSQHGNS
jgi:hypothetical protein